MNRAWHRQDAKRLGISAMIALGLWWFTTQFPYGAYLDGLVFRLYASYANDLLQPFGLYFALCALDVVLPPLRPWQRKAALTVAIPLGMELWQLFWRSEMAVSLATAEMWGLGFAFDPLDILAYVIGALSAAGVERLLWPLSQQKLSSEDALRTES